MGELGRKFLHKLPDMEILRNLESTFILWIQIDIYFLASTNYKDTETGNGNGFLLRESVADGREHRIDHAGRRGPGFGGVRGDPAVMSDRFMCRSLKLCEKAPIRDS